jgi:hypothetical protein
LWPPRRTWLQTHLPLAPRLPHRFPHRFLEQVAMLPGAGNVL